MLDRGEDPVTLLADRAGELDKRRQPAAPRPLKPAVQELLGLVGRALVDLPQLLLEQVRAVGAGVRSLDHRHFDRWRSVRFSGFFQTAKRAPLRSNDGLTATITSPSLPVLTSSTTVRCSPSSQAHTLIARTSPSLHQIPDCEKPGTPEATGRAPNPLPLTMPTKTSGAPLFRGPSAPRERVPTVPSAPLPFPARNTPAGSDTNGNIQAVRMARRCRQCRFPTLSAPRNRPRRRRGSVCVGAAGCRPASPGANAHAAAPRRG